MSRPTLLDLAKARGKTELGSMLGKVEELTQANPLLLDAPYEAALQPVIEHLSRTVGGFDPYARSVPFSFVDPLEQLELGRWTDPVAFVEALGVKLHPWQHEMLRRVPWRRPR